MAICINDIAPDFTVDSTGVGKFTLHDWIGDWYGVVDQFFQY